MILEKVVVFARFLAKIAEAGTGKKSGCNS